MLRVTQKTNVFYSPNRPGVRRGVPSGARPGVTMADLINIKTSIVSLAFSLSFVKFLLFTKRFLSFESLFLFGHHLLLGHFHLFFHRRHRLLSLSPLLTPPGARLFHRVEHGAHFGQPSRFHGRHALHVFLYCAQILGISVAITFLHFQFNSITFDVMMSSW